MTAGVFVDRRLNELDAEPEVKATAPAPAASADIDGGEQMSLLVEGARHRGPGDRVVPGEVETEDVALAEADVAAVL